MITIIIPSFNRADIISETLNSVLSQIYHNWECIIVDDGSSDHTEEVVKKFIKNDSRFSFYHRPDGMLKGANSCRNFGFLKAKGEYIKFLDSDDLLTDDCLQKQVTVLNSNPELQVCLSYGRYFNDETRNLEEYWSRNMEYPDYLLGHITNQIRWAVSDPLWRKAFFYVPPFKEGLMNSQEWLMHGEAFAKLKEKQIFNLKETFTLIRRGNLRMSSKRSSVYFKNQRKSRILMLKSVLSEKTCPPAVKYQLFKQILVFSYWISKTK